MHFDLIHSEYTLRRRGKTCITMYVLNGIQYTVLVFVFLRFSLKYSYWLFGMKTKNTVTWFNIMWYLELSIDKWNEGHRKGIKDKISYFSHAANVPSLDGVWELSTDTKQTIIISITRKTDLSRCTCMCLSIIFKRTVQVYQLQVFIELKALTGMFEPLAARSKAPLALSDTYNY